MIKTDVCIIGAGPAGASTSLMLSKLQIKHFIIDKSDFPRDKTCGDGLILHAYKSLKKLELFDEFLRHPKFIHSKNIKVHINNDHNIQFQESLDRDMVISYGKRFHFDQFLVNELSEEFAKCEFGNGVQELKEVSDGIVITLKDGKEIFTKVLVGADGIKSIVSNKMARNTLDNKKTSTFISAYFKDVTCLPTNKEAEIRIFYKNIPLFFYIFPLVNNEVNVTLGANTQKLLKHRINLKEEVLNIINMHPIVAPKFEKAQRASSWRCWAIPYNYRKQKICGNRFLLVGDAAGLANAFYKEGVGTGMMSGIICAEKIANCLKEDDFSEPTMLSYRDDIQKEFGKLLVFSELVLGFSKFKFMFSLVTRFAKKMIEKRTSRIIKNRSY